jgi:hypothetical protein
MRLTAAVEAVMVVGVAAALTLAAVAAVTLVAAADTSTAKLTSRMNFGRLFWAARMHSIRKKGAPPPLEAGPVGVCAIRGPRRLATR